MCRVWRSNYEQRERREEETAHGPDVSHTLHMWLWLTFHLPAWPPASHPSLASHLPVRMSAVFLDTASAAHKRLRPRPLTICGLLLPLICLWPNRASPSTFRAYLEKSGTDRDLPQAPDGADASAHKKDQILMIEMFYFEILPHFTSKRLSEQL